MAFAKEQIKVTLDSKKNVTVRKGTALLELAKEFSGLRSETIIAARVDNDIKELTYELYDDCNVCFIDLTEEDGMRIYRRSLYFIFMKAANDLFPDRRVIISHAVGRGLYCELRGDRELQPREVEILEKRMHEIAEQAIPFEKREMPLQEAEALFESTDRMDRYRAIEHRNKQLVTIYNCGGMDDYFYGYMAPDTGYIKVFGLKYYQEAS